MKYSCAHCGEWVSLEEIGVDFLDSGTTLKCPHCDRETIVDLFRPEERAKLYGFKTTEG